VLSLSNQDSKKSAAERLGLGGFAAIEVFVGPLSE
jgi:hypothetical protein